MTQEIPETPQTDTPARLGTAGFVPVPHDDDGELAAAREEAVQPEGEQPEATPTEDDQAPVTTDGTPQPAPAPQPGPDGRPVMIPKPRFDEVLAKSATALLERDRRIAYLEGQLDARTGQPATDGNPAAPDPQARRDALEQELEALDGKYEDGEITFRQLRQAERALNASITAIDDETRTQPGNAPRQDLYLAEKTAEITAEFPVFADPSLTQADISACIPLAEREAERRGINISPGPVGDLNLRRLTAEVAQRTYGGGTLAPAAPTARPVTRQSATAKAALTARLPPDLGTIATPNGARERPVTLEAVENMDPDDFAALPESMRKRLREA